MRCREILLKIQRKGEILGTLETTYLVEINKVELVSEGHDKKKLAQKLENFPLNDVKKYHKCKECVGGCRQMQGKW